MDKIARYLSAAEAAALMQQNAAGLDATEVAVVQNLDYVFSPFEFYPLAPRVTEPLPRIAAFAVDMDGTSTTTEPLAVHALEYMVRRFTNRLSRDEWTGLDKVNDYPFIIGNSNFRHTEFLVDRYSAFLQQSALAAAFIEAVVWTLSCMDDPHRRKDIRLDAVNCGLGAMLENEDFRRRAGGTSVSGENASTAAAPFVARYGNAFQTPNRSALTSAAMDIYYYRYHSILRQVERGDGDALSMELLGEPGRHLVEPMPGYAVFLALVKGLLGGEAAEMAPELLRHLSPGAVPEGEARTTLAALGKRFGDQPARLGLVTASIAYETHATVRAIFDVMREEVWNWPIAEDTRNAIVDRFADYTTFYDGFVCATDASEARLKPHRDLYAIALYQMSIPSKDYRYCIGLEDSEPGIISLRAAGVGCAVALPNHDTTRQNYEAAAHVVHGGLPEFILKHNLLLAET
jgi:beta-phosphoglucomutase-like phosphatase (HAD superfamily)